MVISGFAEVQGLKRKILLKGEELGAEIENLAKTDPQMKTMGQKIAALVNQLAKSRHPIGEMIEHLFESDAERNDLIEEF
jgi:transposase